jgi:hypothetical protein
MQTSTAVTACAAARLSTLVGGDASFNRQGAKVATNEELHDDPTAHLLRRLTDQTSILIRQEMELARVEMQAEAAPVPPRRQGSGPTALFGLGATGAFVAGVILALSTVIEAWMAAFGVALAFALLAIVSAAAGRRGAEQVSPEPMEAEPMEAEPLEPELIGRDFEPAGESIEVYAQPGDPQAEAELMQAQEEPAQAALADQARAEDFRV